MSQYTLEDFVDDGHECPTCGKVLDTERGMKSHHARVHGESISGVDVECPNCGDELNVWPSRIERSENVFCSVECENKYHSENLTGEDHPLSKEYPTVECEWCGDAFEVKPARESEARFCGYECMGKWHSNRERESTSVIKECAICGDDFEVDQWRADTAKTCSFECSGEYRSRHYSGPDSPHWDGGKGVYQAVRRWIHSKPWTQVRREARERLGGTCEMCGSETNANGGHMDIHHIVPIMYGGSNHEDNLMALCSTCHRKAESYTKGIPEINPVLVE